MALSVANSILLGKGLAATPPKIAAVVLAAGLSSRMSPRNKLLLTDAAGRTMISRVVDAALMSRVCCVWVVVGHQAAQMRSALVGREIRLVDAPSYASGLALSLASGVAALPDDVEAALICLGDMPEVSTALINEILDAYRPGAGRLIVVPVHGGCRGNPVLWARRYFSDILDLTGDRGARELLLRHARAVYEIEVSSDGVLRDFDTPEELAVPAERPPCYSPLRAR